MHSILDSIAPSQDEIDVTLLDSINHTMSIECGDDAVSADAAIAEQTILARHPAASYVSICRTQKRVRVGAVASFSTEWIAFLTVDGTDAIGIHADLDRAVSIALAKLPRVA